MKYQVVLRYLLVEFCVNLILIYFMLFHVNFMFILC